MKHPASDGGGSTMILRVEDGVTVTPIGASAPGPVPSVSGSTRKEVRARVMLLQPVSAARNKQGDVILSRLLEPLQWDDQVTVPEGSTVWGMIVKDQPPRRLRRAGSMRMSFGKLELPGGESEDVSAWLAAVEAPKGSPLTADSEGTLRAGLRNKKREARDVVLGYLIGKVTDDLLEEGVKAGLRVAGSGTLKTAARYAGIGTGLAFFFAQRGRDVALPKYTELEIVVARSGAPADRTAARPLNHSN